MKTPEIPQDEQERVASLQSLEVLDTAHEERFDRLTRMAMRLFEVPIALVSLVDTDRQWFKSCMGLDATETPRDISFCGHAILGSDLFMIPDALEDERFADNPLVTGAPKIRFYAGWPLRGPDDHKLGTLCIIDREPREFGPQDIEALKDLAAMAEAELAAVQMATMDELTGISNRRGFTALAQHGLDFAARHKTPAALVYLDLDKFKLVNDTFGHAEGDRVLQVFARQMKEIFRTSDLYARMGGDEFAALLSNTSEQAALAVISRFRRSIEELNKAANRGYDIEYSHGIVEYNPDKHPSLEALLADADELMYEQKKAGGFPRSA